MDPSQQLGFQPMQLQQPIFQETMPTFQQQTMPNFQESPFVFYPEAADAPAKSETTVELTPEETQTRAAVVKKKKTFWCC